MKNMWMTCKRIKVNPYLTQYRKINSKWIKELNLRAKTIKLLGENLHDNGFGNDFLAIILKAQATKVKMNCTTSK